MESQNYIRLQMLLSGEGSKILREIFKRRYRLLTTKEWETGEEFSKKLLEKFSKSNVILPKQKELLKEEDLDKFDISLLSSLISQMEDPLATSEQKRYCRSENSAISELVRQRNRVAHIAGIRVDTDLFEELWEKIRKALTSLGVAEDSINEIRNGSQLEGIAFESVQTVEEELEKVKIIVGDGDLAMKRGDYEKAIANFSGALLSQHLPDEERLSILINRSEALLESILGASHPSKDEVEDKCERAMVDTEEIIKTDPQCWKGYLMAGKVLKCTEIWKSAIDMFDRALAINPGLPEALKHRSECRSEMSKVNRKEQRNPQTLSVGLDQFLNKFSEQRGFGPTKETVLKENNAMLNHPDLKKRAQALCFRGNLYEQGIDFELDCKKAVNYYEQAAQCGDILSMCLLGTMHIEGKGVTRDVDKGVELIEQAARSNREDNENSKIGLAQAQHCLGKCFEDGVGKPQDLVQAAEWYLRASKNGSGPAAHNLGILFYDGRGVPPSADTAKQYWRLAASRGSVLSMDLLAWMYLNEYNPDLAEQWYNQSLERDNLNSGINKYKFFDALAEVRLAIQKCEKTNPTVEDITEKISELRIASSVDLGHPEAYSFSSAESEPVSVVRMFQGKDSGETITGKLWKQREEIRKRALSGHTFAQDIIHSMKFFAKGYEALEAWRTFDAENNEVLEWEVLENMANCLRHQEIVVFTESGLTEDLRKISYAHMAKGKEKSDVDINARVCYSSVLVNCRSTELFPFLDICSKKYPQEKLFYKFHAGTLACLQKFTEALNIINRALERFPTDSGFLFEKASSMKLLSNVERYKYEDIITAYEKFIAAAPFDDRMMPEVYYNMAYLTSTIGKNIPNASEIMERYYKLGLEAEENILPCFLPYDVSQAKRICAAKMGNKWQNSSQSEGGRSAQLGENRTINNSKIQLTNPQRVQAVVRFRKMAQRVVKVSSANYKSNFTLEPKLKHEGVRNLAGLVEITFNDMVTTKDQVYNGRLLNLTATEDPMFLTAAHIIAKDKNNDNLNIAVYGLDEATDKAELSFGSQFSIINPYFQIAGPVGYLQLVIRVDDPRTIIFHSDVKKLMCRFCWKENPQHTCTKCKRSKYCSKECQTDDWNLLKHKFICNFN